MNNPLPRAQQPLGFEGSRLASPRDRRNPAYDWHRGNALARAQGNLIDTASVMTRQAAQFKRPLVDLGRLHPFAIIPTGFLTSHGNGSGAQCGFIYRVHGGHVLGVGYAAGTDGSTVDTTPSQMVFADGFDIALPEPASPGMPGTLYVWLEWTGSAARILWGPDPTATSYNDLSSPTHPVLAGATSTNSWDHTASPWTGVSPWASAPVQDGSHAMIGIVDAGVGGFGAGIANGVVGPIAPTIRQYLCSDFDPSGGSGGGFSTFAFYQMSTNSADCVQAYLYDTGTGTINYGGGVYDVALPWELRPSQHTSETIDNVGTVTYTYTIGSQKRKADWTDAYSVAHTTYQKITPQIIVGQVFRAFNVGMANNGAGPTWGGGSLFTPFEMVPRFWAWDPAITS